MLIEDAGFFIQMLPPALDIEILALAAKPEQNGGGSARDGRRQQLKKTHSRPDPPSGPVDSHNSFL